ncbi:hypothetical protein GOODEAATRI_026393, partial [Goodea atripinnis]
SGETDLCDQTRTCSRLPGLNLSSCEDPTRSSLAQSTHQIFPPDVDYHPTSGNGSGVVNAKGVSFPVPFTKPSTNDLANKFTSAHPTCRGLVRPRFPAVTVYLPGVMTEPLQLKAPVSIFTPITRVEYLRDQGFPPVLVWEPSLSAVFRVRRWPVPPSSRDQITAILTDCSHQCATQVAVATNNTAFLAYVISKKAREMDLPPERGEILQFRRHHPEPLCSVGCVLLPHHCLADLAAATDMASALLLHS